MRRRRRTVRFRPGRALLALLVLMAAYLSLHSPLFQVAAVEVRGASALDPAQVVAWAGLGTAVPIWRVDTALAERRLAAHPLVAGARVYRRWPRRIVVELVERRPVGYAPVAGGYAAVDGDGRVLYRLPRLPEGGLRLEVGQAAERPPGDALPPAARPAAVAAAYVRQYGLDWVEAVRLAAPGDVELRLRGGVRVRFGPVDRQPDRKLAVLAALWREWAPRRERVEAIDVRDPLRPAVRLRPTTDH